MSHRRWGRTFADSMAELDPFSAERYPKLAKRLRKLREEEQRRHFEAWIGTLGLNFTDDELGILETMGNLTEEDLIGMTKLGRPVQPVPLPGDVASPPLRRALPQVTFGDAS